MNTLSTIIDDYKKVMGAYPTGVAVITTYDESGKPYGLTVNSVASISLDPLLILWSLDNKSDKLRDFQQYEKFTIHILSEQQAEICWRFAGKIPAEKRFDNIEWKKSENGLPIINGAVGVFECETYQELSMGDHTIFVGKVINVIASDNNPLLYYKRHVDAIPKNWLPS